MSQEQERLNAAYKDILIPEYIEEEECYVVNTEDGVKTGDLYYILSEFCKDGVIYRYNNRFYEDFPDHMHDFSGVLEAVLEEPETFSIENYLDDYSVKERAFLYNLRDTILMVKKENKIFTMQEIGRRGPEYYAIELERERKRYHSQNEE